MNTRWTWIIAAGVAGTLYVTTAAPGLLWGDSGDAQLRLLLGHFYDRRWLSRCHVLYYLLADVLTVAGLTPAYAATLLSALAGAVTVGNVAVLISLLTARVTSVVCGVALLLLSHCLWHIATVAEVMTCSTALLSAELLLVTRFVQTRKVSWLVAAGFVNGLGLAAHNFALLIWPAYAVLLLMLIRQRTPISFRHMAIGFAAWLVGAAPFFALVIHLSVQTGDFANVLARMLTGGYVSNVFNTTVPLRLLGRTLAYFVYSFPTPLIIAAPAGIAALWRRSQRPLSVFLFTAFGVYFAFAARYNVPDQHVFLLHSFLFVAVFAAVGIDRVCRSAASCGSRTGFKLRPPARDSVLLALACLAPIVYAVVPGILRTHFPTVPIVPTRYVPHRDPYAWFLKPWRDGYQGPERFARETLDALPANAVLTVDSTLVPPFLYLQAADNLRRDVRILSARHYQTWFDDHIDIASASERDRIIEQQRLFTPTDVRRSWNGHLRDPQYDVVPYGPVYRFVHASDTPTAPVD